MKKCSTCQVKKVSKDFYKKTKTSRSSMCKSCFNSYCIKRWIKNKKEAIDYKGGKCFDCKRSFPYPAYDFHHLDPATKEYSWVKMRLMSASKRKTELDKCVLLCAVCHRMRHHNELS